MARRQRLDLELVERGLAASRQQAQQLIRAGRVRSGDQVLDKPGTAVAPELVLVLQQPPRFVSRGGEKLARALESLPIAVAGRVCLDGGISTGGFSDCLLQHGAARIYGIDVGYGQTAWSLRSDPRVVLRERTNLRHLSPHDLYGPDDPRPDLAVADVSFISLVLVLPALLALLAPGAAADLVLLVKPQFEVGKARVGKGGVVRDPAAHADAISGVIAAAGELGLEPWGLVASPITGPAGNHEYLLWLRRGAGGKGVSEALEAIGQQSVQHPESGGAGTGSPAPKAAAAAQPVLAPIHRAQIEVLVASTLTASAVGEG
jgi:23S rRNA (cytidine1920-2'-O)/16S rRNA (cytidine1409-2'-O)-methyltransferase